MRSACQAIRRGLLSAAAATACAAVLAAGPAAARAADADDWPTWRHDNSRSGVTTAKVRPPLSLHWQRRLQHAPAPAWGPPAAQDFWHHKTRLRARVDYDRAFQLVADQERVYFGSSADDQVRALNLADGSLAWTHYCEGPVRLAPTLWQGRLYVGADDGRVVCLEARRGRVVWTFDASPSAHLLAGNGRLIAAHPVRSGVLITGGVARFASGLFPVQGVWQFAVDARTGKQLARGALNFSPQGYMQQRGERLMIAGGRAAAGFLTKLTAEPARKAAATPRAAAKEFPYSAIATANTVFAGGVNQVAAFDKPTGELLWKAAVEGRALALAAVEGRLLVSTDRGVVACFGAPRSQPPKRIALEPKLIVGRSARAERLATYDARNILKLVPVRRGYALMLSSDEDLLFALATQSSLKIVVVPENPAKVASLRRKLNETGLYGRVVVRSGGWKAQRFAPRFFNLICFDRTAESAPKPREMLACLRPYDGLLRLKTPLLSEDETRKLVKSLADASYLGEDATSTHSLHFLRRKPLQGAGEWTHMYGGPENRSSSTDKFASGKLRLQWFGRPGPRPMVDRHHRATPPLVQKGVLFIPGNEQIFAVDAYNGTVRWNAEVSRFRRVGAPRDGGNLAATPDTLYAVAGDRCYAIDSAEGAIENSFAPPEQEKERSDWGYVAVVGPRLYGSATAVGASRSGHNRKQIAETYYDFVPIVVSHTLFCKDRRTGKPIWSYRLPAGRAVLNPTITIGDDQIFFVEGAATSKQPGKRPGRVRLTEFVSKQPELVALDRETGKLRWRRAAPFAALQHHLYLAYTSDRLVAVGTRNGKAAPNRRATVRYDLFCFNAKDGTDHWRQSQDQQQAIGGSHGEQDHHPVIVGSRVLQEPYAYDLPTGKRDPKWKFHRGGHGCGTVSASASSLFFRAGNPTMCDLATGQKTKINRVSRPGCWINILPAAGMLLIPEASSGCTCNFAVQASMGYAPAAK